jgi:hypothetical protein
MSSLRLAAMLFSNRSPHCIPRRAGGGDGEITGRLRQRSRSNTDPSRPILLTCHVDTKPVRYWSARNMAELVDGSNVCVKWQRRGLYATSSTSPASLTLHKWLANYPSPWKFLWPKTDKRHTRILGRYVAPVWNTRRPSAGWALMLNKSVLQLILTEEVDEIQIVRGVEDVEIDWDVTCVDKNSDESDGGPCDALNLERVIRVYLEYHHLLLVS